MASSLPASGASPRTGLHTLPALKVALILIAGITTAYWIPVSVTLLGAASIIFLILGIITRRRSVSSLWTALALFSAAFLSGQLALQPCHFTANTIQITGRTLEPAYKTGQGWQTPVKLVDLQPLNSFRSKVSGKVWLRVRKGTILPAAGSIIQVHGVLTPLRQRRNPQDYDLGGWRLRNGYRGELGADNDRAVKIIAVRPRLREWFYTRALNWSRCFKAPDAPLVMALLCGVRRDMDDAFLEDLKRTGLSHLIALSGLHLGFVAALLIGLGSIFRLPLRLRYLTALAGVGIYTLLITPRGSAVRAAVMAGTLLLGPILRRWSSPTNNLALAAVVILTVRPGELFDAGFQMSFAAVSGILLLLPWMDEMRHQFTRRGAALRRFNRYLWSPFMVSLAASLMVLPLTSYHFGQAAWGAPLFNLAAVPLLGVICSGLWLSWLVSVLAPFLGSILIDGMSGLFSAWRFITHQGADFGWFEEIRLSPLAIALIIGIIFWGGGNYYRRRLRLPIAALALCAVLVWDKARAEGDSFQAWFLDAGPGDACVWLFPQGRTAVIDGGPETDSAYGVTSSFLKYKLKSHVDLIAATHPEADHIGGLINLINDFPVTLAICGVCSASTQTFQRLSSISQTRNLRWIPVKAGDVIEGLPAGYRLRVLNPPRDRSRFSTNDASVVLMLEMKLAPTDTLRILMTGDIERAGEKTLLKQGGLRADLLKAAHHGSNTSSSAGFLDQVQPQMAIISQASLYERSRLAEPEKTLNRLRQRGIAIHQTGLEGAVCFKAVRQDGHWRWRTVDWRNPGFFQWLRGGI
ncbi:MAG: ComEC/Rec2 family competence protein [Calditrichota bacterium]